LPPIGCRTCSSSAPPTSALPLPLSAPPLRLLLHLHFYTWPPPLFDCFGPGPRPVFSRVVRLFCCDCTNTFAHRRPSSQRLRPGLPLSPSPRLGWKRFCHLRRMRPR
jgi:hypothetical protein